jgi:hypothetical protein
LVDLGGVGDRLRLGDHDVVVVRDHDLRRSGCWFGGCWWFLCWGSWSRLGLGLRDWVADVTFTCTPGEWDTFHEVVVG